MGAKVVSNFEQSDVKFEDIGPGEWFLHDGGLCMKPYDPVLPDDRSFNSFWIDADGDLCTADLVGSDKVTPVDVTITYKRKG